jgi:PII-like signaling protein
VAHLVEDRCQGWPNTLATVVTPGEICIFTAHKSRTPGHERILLEEMGQALLRTARSQGLALARVGISGLHTETTELLRAYHEASSALDSGHSTLNWFDALPERHQQPAQTLGNVLKALQAGQSASITAAVREFLAGAVPAAARAEQLQQARGLLTWACEHLAREMASLGVNAALVNTAKERAVQIQVGSPSCFAMAEAFRSFIDQLQQQLMQLFSQRDEKIVIKTQRLVRELGPEKVTIQHIARDLKLSAGHLDGSIAGLAATRWKSTWYGNGWRWRGACSSTRGCKSRTGAASATVLKGIAGFGADHHLHSSSLVDISDHLPLKIEFIETREKVDELLGKLEELAGTGMIELQETTIAKPARSSKPKASPVPEHIKIEGKAQMMQIYIGESD